MDEVNFGWKVSIAVIVTYVNNTFKSYSTSISMSLVEGMWPEFPNAKESIFSCQKQNSLRVCTSKIERFFENKKQNLSYQSPFEATPRSFFGWLSISIPLDDER
jgi:hypothetical protein